VDKRAWSSANDGTVRIGAALRIDAIDLTFSMKITGKDGMAEDREDLILVRVANRLEGRQYSLRRYGTIV
jgi:hypothetical protein